MSTIWVGGQGNLSFADALCADTTSTSEAGTLTDSGGSTGRYSNSETCSFLIEVSAGSVIELDFQSFRYENTYDFLRVYDGNSTGATRLGEFTGPSVPAAVSSTSNQMLIIHESDNTVTRDGFVATWSTSVQNSCPDLTVADNFDAVSYSQNAGSQNWLTNWLEIGESDGESSGIARVNNSNCSAGNCLRLGEPGGPSSWTDRGVSRSLDLSASTNASLTFNYFTGFSTGSQSVTLQVSTDNANWQTLSSYSVTSTNFSATPQTFDLSAYTGGTVYVRFLTSGNSATTGFYVDDVRLTYDQDCSPTTHAEYRFDAASWSGVSGEVLDSGGNGYDGTASSAGTTADGVVCRAADFTASGSDYLDIDYRALDGLEDFTISIWAKTSASNQYQTILSGANASVTNELVMLMETSPEFIPGISITYFSDAAAISSADYRDDVWHHLVWTRDASSNRSCFYLDGTLQGCSNHPSSDDDDPLDIDADGFIISQDQDAVGGGFDTSQAWDGLLDELLIFDSVLPAQTIADIYTNQSAGSNWDGSSRNCSRSIRAEYRFDESSWSETADEVLDSSGNDYHGIAYDAQPVEGKVCRAADLSGVTTTDYVSLNSDALDGLSDFSVSFWLKSAYTGNVAIVSGAQSSQANELLAWFPNSTTMHPYIKGGTSGVAVGSIFNDTWRHVVWTRSGSDNCIYVDGTQAACVTLSTGALAISDGGLILGQEQDSVGGSFSASQSFKGLLDELLIFDSALSSGEISAIYANQNGGLGWDGTARSCEIEIRAEYRFDEASWSETADEVVDSSGHGYHGIAYDMQPTDGKVCRAADFSGTTIADYISLDADALDGLSSFTIAFWMKSAYFGNAAVLSGARSGQANEVLTWLPASTTVRPFIKGGSNTVTISSVFDDTWHHIAWTRSGSNNCIFVDGSQASCVTLSTGSVTIDDTGLVLGQEQDSVAGSFSASQSFKGLLDEVLIFDVALDSSEITSIYDNNDGGLGWDGEARSCPSIGANGFSITHDGAGIHCVREQVTVRAIDSGGDPVTGYLQEVTLDTGTGSGTWSLVTGSGLFSDATADDGTAVYTFVAGDSGQATFGLDYPNGTPIMDIDVFQTNNTSIRDNDAEGNLVFVPTGFTVTANAVSNPPPATINDPILNQTAGVNIDIHLAAYGQDPEDGSCGIIESYQGVKTLAAWQTLVNPTSGTVTASVNDAPIGASEGAATDHTVTFTSGQAVIAGKYKDVGRLRLRFQDVTSGATSIAGSTNEFVSRPADLRIVDVETTGGDDNPAASSNTGTRFVRAGESFVVVVDALDAEGDRTPNYGRESPAEGLVVSSDRAVLPVGGNNGIANDGVLIGGTAFTPQSLAGRFSSSTVAYDDIGVINLIARVGDGDYLGTGQVNGTVSGNIGRFYVHEFTLSGASLSGACSGFTYMDQPELGIGFTVEAKNALGTTVTNYDSGLLGSDIADVTLVAEDADAGFNLGNRLSTSLASVGWSSGTFLLDQSNAAFSRLGTPDGAYLDLQIGVLVTDAVDTRVLDTLDMHAAASGDCALSGNCSAATIGNTQIGYGRLSLLPALGPENVDLPVVAQAEIFQGSGFEPFTSDSCTTYQGSNASLIAYGGNLAAGETLVLGPGASTTLDAGVTRIDSPLLLAAPGFGNDGSADIELITDTWLRFPWSGGVEENPVNTARFGSYRGHDRIVLWMEDP
ncbi:MAG: DUF6701 domain-containing protein [Pseudomonadota bacterium]